MALVLVVLLAAVAAPEVAPPPITSVVVYPDRASVTRRARVACGERVVASFAGLPPAADPASFRAQARGAAVDGLRIEERPRATAYAARVAALEARVVALDLEAAAARQQLAQLEARAAAAEAYQKVAERQVTAELWQARPDIAAWRIAFAAMLELGLEAARARTGVEARLRGLADQRAAARAEADAL